MLGLFARLLRVFWRQDTEGSHHDAIVLSFPTGATTAWDDSRADVLPAAAIVPVAFIRRAAEPIARRPKLENRQLAARLLAVERLNPPSNRVRATTACALVRPNRAVKKNVPSNPGVVLNRIRTFSTRSSAEIVSLTDVRRARQIETANCEIAALFN